ncbi:guanine nucleotide-binding protein G(i) subunit alpha-1-like isoform X2 [Bombina bombina]|uniref:guanine nucleotide-binding protein G(i) subunit alpha-1-like isoform X2 n=1 Tax=Bombina bombina TaxID=8345 RepID=UPI00235B17D5|nr:guanine nucleotide-binding protein G(i) subunit alpha-1-like isoform X2 [Bombina bombina]
MSCRQSSKNRSRSKKIDQYLQQEKKRLRREVKVLLLGTRESGKSTIMKQMKIIYEGDYSEEERRQYRAAVYSDTIQYITDIVSAMESLGIGFGDVARADDARQLAVFARGAEKGVMSEELAGVIKRLWEDVGVQTCFSHSPQYKHNNSASYFLNDLDRICQSDYIPTQKDVLCTRDKTTCFTEVNIPYMDINITLVDPGQHRTNFKKWIHCFSEVISIIFCVDINDYEQLLDKNHEKTKLLDSILVATNTPVIIFFNKKDQFKHSGSITYDHIHKQVLHEELNNPKYLIFGFFSCAQDTQNMRNINFLFTRDTKYCTGANRKPRD